MVAVKFDVSAPKSGGLWSAASDKERACALQSFACAGLPSFACTGSPAFACAGSQSGASQKRNHFWVLLLLLAFLLALLPSPALAQEGGTNRAGLIVVHGDGRVLTRCVTFTEERISGLALLQRSGLAMDANTGPMGSAICTINGEGCPAKDCFCKCKSNPCTYWNYFHRNPDGSWVYSGMGAAMWTVGNGDVEGWVWGDGSASPPNLTFEAICSAALTSAVSTMSSSADPDVTTPTATVTAAPATPTPTATATTVPSTPTPTATATTVPSTSTPTATATATPSHPLTPSPAFPASPAPSVTYALSFPVVVSPGTATYRAPNPLLKYIPYALLLICIVGLAWLKRTGGGRK